MVVGIMTATSEQKRNTAISVAAIIVVLIVAYASYSMQHVIIAAICAGAIGGLFHEIIQSKGTFILWNWDDKGNLYFGSLVGLILGAFAGAIMVGTGATVASSAYIMISAFTAGAALKGVTDAYNPSNAPSQPGTKAS